MPLIFTEVEYTNMDANISMKKLYLHIGFGKTGSSALQSWLSLNSKALGKQGIDYADLAPKAKFNEVSSGNGRALFIACRQKQFDEVERLICSKYFFNPRNSVSIVSCELLQGIKKPTIEKLHDICQRNDIDITIIAYVRSIYEQCYSNYLQRVKRSGATHAYGEEEEDITFSNTAEKLGRYLDVFGSQLTVLNYDNEKHDICGSFSRVTGINPKHTKTTSQRVNRSLTREEMEVLRRLNGFHKGKLSTQLSNYVIRKSPNTKTSVFYDKSMVEILREKYGEDIQWVNRQFGLTPPLVSDFYCGNSDKSVIKLDRSSYTPALKWALKHKPTTKESALDLVNFLREFADFFQEFSTRDAAALIKRASVLKVMSLVLPASKLPR